MSTPFLALNNRDGTQPRVRVYSGCQVSTQGVSFGVLFTETLAPGSNKFMVMQFGGDDDTWVACDGTSIYQTTNAGASWTLRQALAVPIASYNCVNSGIHIIVISGVPTACMFYATSTADQYRGYTSVDGITWTPQGPFTVVSSPANPIPVDVMAYHGSIAMWVQREQASPGVHYLWNPGASSCDSLTFPAGASQDSIGCYVIFRDELHAVLKYSNSVGAHEWRLYNITSGATALAAVLFGPAVGSDSPYHRPTAFVDPATGDLIVWFFGSSWLCKRINAAYAVTDITSAVRPISFPFGANSRMYVYIDQEANLGGAPRLYLYVAADGQSGTIFAQYEWQGFDQFDVGINMGAIVDSGGNSAHSLGAINRSGGGPYTWVSGETRIRIVSWTGSGISSGVRITFKLYSPSGTQSCKVSGFNRSRLQPDTRYPSKLMNPSHGALSGATAGNFNTGLTADNGVTTYQVTIDLEDQGRANFERSAQVLAVTNT